MEHQHGSDSSGWFKPRARWVLLAFLAIAGFFLVTEHRAHLLGFLPFLILLACPLLHVFMHGGHGDHGQGRDQGQGPASEEHQHGADGGQRK
jgi:hypothetical protein